MRTHCAFVARRCAATEPQEYAPLSLKTPKGADPAQPNKLSGVFRSRHPTMYQSTKFDHCSRVGAARLAERIKGYWASRGHAVETWIEEGCTPISPTGHMQKMYFVRSKGIPNTVR